MKGGISGRHDTSPASRSAAGHLHTVFTEGTLRGTIVQNLHRYQIPSPIITRLMISHVNNPSEITDSRVISASPSF